MAIAADVDEPVEERFLVVSCDGHAGPVEVKGYRDCMEQKYLQQFDEYAASFPQLEAVLALAPEDAKGYMIENVHDEAGFDPGVRIKKLEAEGIAAETVFPSHPLAFAPVMLNQKGDSELIIAGARMQNRWIAEFCSAYPGRLAGVAVAPLQIDVAASVAELERASNAGLRAVVIPLPSILWSDYPGYWDPVYDPFWSACESLDMPIIHHPGLMGGFSDANGPGLPGILSMTMDFTVVPRRLLSQLIFSGVFERHPRLKLIFSEIFADWVPSTLRDLDRTALTRVFRAQVEEFLPLTPRQYFERQVYVCASFMSEWEFEHRDEIGVDRVLWGSDLPHLEGSYPETREYLRMAAAGVPAEDMRLILGENALKCYDFLNESQLRGIAAKVGPTVAELSVPLEQVPDTVHGRYSMSFEPRR